MTLKRLPQSFRLGALASDTPIFEVCGIRGADVFAHEMVHHVPSIEPRLQPIHMASLPELKRRVVK